MSKSIAITELQLGDLVNASVTDNNGITHKIPCRIKELSLNDDINRECSRTIQLINTEDAEKFNHVDYFNDIEPILITDDILKKNKWLFDKNSETWSNRNVNCCSVAINEKYEWVKKSECYGEEIYITSCVFVHELQHILRIQGYTPVANRMIV